LFPLIPPHFWSFVFSPSGPSRKSCLAQVVSRRPDQTTRAFTNNSGSSPLIPQASPLPIPYARAQHLPIVRKREDGSGELLSCRRLRASPSSDSFQTDCRSCLSFLSGIIRLLTRESKGPSARALTLFPLFSSRCSPKFPFFLR